jgi:hypothetical protein
MNVVDRPKLAHVTKISRYFLSIKDQKEIYVTPSDGERHDDAKPHSLQAISTFFGLDIDHDKPLVDALLKIMPPRDTMVLLNTAECLDDPLHIRNFLYSCKRGTVAVDRLMGVMHGLRSKRIVVELARFGQVVVCALAAAIEAG